MSANSCHEVMAAAPEVMAITHKDSLYRVRSVAPSEHVSSAHLSQYRLLTYRGMRVRKKSIKGLTRISMYLFGCTGE